MPLSHRIRPCLHPSPYTASHSVFRGTDLISWIIFQAGHRWGIKLKTWLGMGHKGWILGASLRWYKKEIDTVGLAVLRLRLRVSVNECVMCWLGVLESRTTPPVVTYYPLWHIGHLILKWFVISLLKAECNFLLFLTKQCQDDAMGVYMQAPIFCYVSPNAPPI